MVAFIIVLVHNRKRYHLQVEQLSSDNPSFELFKIYPTANPAKAIILQSNRPVLIRHKLKHKAIDWKVIKGQALNRGAFEETIKAIEKELKSHIET